METIGSHSVAISLAYFYTRHQIWTGGPKPAKADVIRLPDPPPPSHNLGVQLLWQNHGSGHVSAGLLPSLWEA